jgi:cytochrome c553
LRRAAAVLFASVVATLSGARPAAGQAPESRLALCLACHGGRGQSEIALTPSLGGQPSFYVVAQLFLFREGRRDNPVMTEAARGLKDAELQFLADAIAQLPPPSPPAGTPAVARLARGRALAAQRHCEGCHGADFAGHDNVPRVAHQREDYLLKALRDYRSGRRIGYGNAVMTEAVAGLADEDLAALAHMLAYWKR